MDVSNISAAFLSVVAILLGAIFWYIVKKSRSDGEEANYPPIDSGWIPWLGCAIDFGKAPLLKIPEKRKQLGPIFTLYLAGKRMTFLTEAEDFHHFFQSPNVNFQEAVVDTVNHTAGVPKSAFYRSHTKLHDTVKGRLSGPSLEQIGDRLCAELNEAVGEVPSKYVGNVAHLVRKVMYKSGINNLFGRKVLSSNKEEFEKLLAEFVKFDQGFEYGSQLPEFFLRDWSKCKQRLLSKFKNAKVGFEKANGEDQFQTVFQSISQTVGDVHSHSFGLLFMWAALSNAVPVAFWTLVHIASDPDIMKRVKDDIRSVLGKYEEGKYVHISESSIKQMPFIRHCVLEAVRLHSAGVVARKVMQTFKIKGYTIPAGDMLIISPYWAHRNPQYFPEPNKFNPDRWKDVELDKKKFLEGFVAFGNGRYQCPGRWFALLEMQMSVVMLLMKYDVKLVNGVPKESPLHIVGTQQPATECLAELTLAA